jgi:hypothetical protein
VSCGVVLWHAICDTGCGRSRARRAGDLGRRVGSHLTAPQTAWNTRKTWRTRRGAWPAARVLAALAGPLRSRMTCAPRISGRAGAGRLSRRARSPARPHRCRAFDTESTYWVIEARRTTVPKTTECSARRTPPRGGPGPSATTAKYGIWRYVFATEADIKQAAGSWTALLVTTKPE